jgi:biotin/methionine sulfoxide reductase
MGVVLAALLGQSGLPGGGFAYALGSTSNTGKPPLAVPLPTLPIGQNSIADFIPVARIADMLLNPGERFDFNGRRLSYPEIKLVYWAGGNPFHHHQDLNRLREAFARSWFTIRCGRRARGTPISCCRRRSHWSARTSAAPPAIRCLSRCIAQ